MVSYSVKFPYKHINNGKYNHNDCHEEKDFEQQSLVSLNPISIKIIFDYEKNIIDHA